MSDNVEKALAFFREGNGFNCAQSILRAFGPQLGLDEGLDRIAGAFGGGLARTGQFCGAVSGALMVIGLKYGMLEIEDREQKKATYDKAKDFVARFVEKRGTLLCRELLGHDTSTPEGHAAIKELNLAATICTAVIRDAAEILEGLL